MLNEKQTARARNAALRVEIDAWLAVTDDSAPTQFVNIRAMGFASKQDAERWARTNEVPYVSEGGKLLARRADVDAAQASPARERIFYKTSADDSAQHDTRAAAADALRVAMGWNAIALSHDIEMPVVTAFETEAESVRIGADQDPTAPRIFRRSEIVRVAS